MKKTQYKKIKEQNSIQILSDNDKYYDKYNRDSDTYYIRKEDEKKLLSQIKANRTKKIKKER